MRSTIVLFSSTYCTYVKSATLDGNIDIDIRGQICDSKKTLLAFKTTAGFPKDTQRNISDETQIFLAAAVVNSLAFASII